MPLDIKKPLSPRELDCLNWIAQGKTSWETSRILQMSQRTVDYHIQSACTKLNAANRTAAVACAIRRRLVE
ncbi:helix-turn-helix domain-containing protein [Corticimicrobacter populi]|uniref:helix-turn-helix domain-containing protein n=1 Tax=Corticimicrobacter populi TaxID=2175229 RepID=UPI0026CFD949